MVVPVGIDVGSKELVVAYRRGLKLSRRTFANTNTGRETLSDWLPKDVSCRVSVEATGFYSMDVCVMLDERANTEVMVANPRSVANFAKAMLSRGKTDPLDAEVLVEYAQRMPFRRWARPSKQAMELRAITRRMGALRATVTAEKNRYKSAAATKETPSLILEDIKETIELLEGRISALEKKAVERIKADATLTRRFELLTTMSGVATTSAVKLLGELAMLPADMTARQWVAHAGLDPRPWKSGTSINRPAKVTKAGNKYLRGALFIPALVGVQRDPAVKGFYDHLVIDLGKKKLPAVVAVMRKYLHAIYGMWKNDQPFDGQKLYPAFKHERKSGLVAGSPSLFATGPD